MKIRHRLFVVLALICIAPFSPVEALHAQTLTLDGCATFDVISGSGTGALSIRCNQASAPPIAVPPQPGAVDMSACTAAGFTGMLIDLPYSTVANYRVTSAGFSGGNALVVRFTVPLVARDTAWINIVQNGTSQSIYHLATLSNLPCQFATQASPTGDVLAATYGTSPSFSLGVNVPVFTQFGGAATPTLLQPGNTYYLTIVNRNGYYGTPSFLNSCAYAGRCDVNINFSN